MLTGESAINLGGKWFSSLCFLISKPERMVPCLSFIHSFNYSDRRHPLCQALGQDRAKCRRKPLHAEGVCVCGGGRPLEGGGSQDLTDSSAKTRAHARRGERGPGGGAPSSRWGQVTLGPWYLDLPLSIHFACVRILYKWRHIVYAFPGLAFSNST